MAVCSALITWGNLFCFRLKNRSNCSLGIIKTQLTDLKDFISFKGMVGMLLQEKGSISLCYCDTCIRE